jgi:hypothetical protein
VTVTVLGVVGGIAALAFMVFIVRVALLRRGKRTVVMHTYEQIGNADDDDDDDDDIDFLFGVAGSTQTLEPGHHKVSASIQHNAAW